MLELIESVRILWRSRALTAIALAVAIVVGVLVAFKLSVLPPGLHSRTHTVGRATAQVLIDTQRSQISDVDPAGAQNLYARATLLADVLATAPTQLKLAQTLHVSPFKLEVTPPAGSGLTPVRPTALGTAGATASTVTPSWLLTITQDPTLPLIGLTSQAPTVADAAALAHSAIEVLEQQVRSSALAQGTPTARRVVINTISPPVAGPAVQGIRKAFGLVAVLTVFCLGCFGIVIWEGSARAQRKRHRSLRTALWRWFEGHRVRERLGLLVTAVRTQIPRRPPPLPARGARAAESSEGVAESSANTRPESERVGGPRR